MSSADTSAVTSGFISSLWGVNVPPSTVTDTQLATALLPYLGKLPAFSTDANGNITGDPFTQNMTLSAYNDVNTFLTDLQNGAPDVTLQADLTQVLSDAQTPQTPQLGQPAPIPPNSGGLARNTASALASIIASLQSAGILTNLSGTTYTVDTTGGTTTLASWLSSASNQALIQAAQTQLTQDVPTATGSITVNGQTQNITVPLNQSLQAVLKTEYVDQGANIVYGGLQALVNQQNGAENAINVLNELQTVYNGIQTIPPDSNVITNWNTSNFSTFQSSLATFLYGQLPQSGTLDFYQRGSVAFSLTSDQSLQNTSGSPPVYYFANATALQNAMSITNYNPSSYDYLTISVSGGPNYSLYLPNITGSGAQATNLSSFITANMNSNPVETSQGVDISEQFFNTFIGQQFGPGTTNSIFQSQTVSAYLATLDSGNPAQYMNDLPNILPDIFPQPGASFNASSVQLNGAVLSTAAGGNMEQLINQVYQTYLDQAAQRLITADPNIIPDPNMTIDNATGQVGYIVNPAVTGTAAQVSADNLQVVRSILAYANTLNVPGGTGTVNLTTSSAATIPLVTTAPTTGVNGTLTGNVPTGAGDSVTIGGKTYSFSFGSAQGGGLESSLATILGGLVGGSAFIGGDSSVTGAVTFDSSGNLSLTQWILGAWNSSNATSASGTALDQTESQLTNAFSAASAVNSELQQQLQQSFFLFQEFMQSATDTLSQISQEIVKKAQAVAG